MAHDNTTSLISSASLDAVAEGGCRLSAVERKERWRPIVTAPGPRCCRRVMEAVGWARRTEAARWSMNCGGEGGGGWRCSGEVGDGGWRPASHG
jgi:hypothetical protein